MWSTANTDRRDVVKQLRKKKAVGLLPCLTSGQQMAARNPTSAAPEPLRDCQ
ncbi:hypothetical protein SAMCFNEI73_pC1724 (plasmid) [Sinorhizobium americanum]|uniref:Uncharacterized protein n=1 Tax=Sinorhizobium americanum TaxID=194963 RepID=A0A1L3LZC5_9HYPH|nr:hypothetical protein SAMCFNEI73_pC1724 [Sinorhizobium americanum]